MIDIAVVNPSLSPAKCAEVGVRKIISTFYEGVLESHEWLRCCKPTGAADIECYGQYSCGESRELLLNLGQEAHQAGVEVHPYTLVAVAGVWTGSRRAIPRNIAPDGRIPRFAVENPEYMSKARDGRSWLDWEVGEQVLGYDVGYMSLAYPEVRDYVRAALVAYVQEFGADGVQLSYPNSDSGSWYVNPARIRKEISAVKEVVGERCDIYGTVLGKNGGGYLSVGDLVEGMLAAAKAMIESGSDGFSTYVDEPVMAEDSFWRALNQIHTERF